MEESWFLIESDAKQRVGHALAEAERHRLRRALHGQGEASNLGALWSRLAGWFDRSNGRAGAELSPDRPIRVQSKPQEQCC
mgnify:CR=1 FL=1